MWAGRTLSGVDRFGKWVATGFDGWWDSPETRGETADVPNSDGEYDLPVYSEARLVTATGHLHATSHAQLHEAMNFFTGAMSGRLQVAGHGSIQWADANRNSGVKFTPVTDTFAQWQVRLKCVDPFKYGDVTQFPMASNGDYVTLFHRGNHVAYPRVVISGSASGGYQLRHPDGAVYNVTRALSSGSPHEVDMRTGLLRVGGVVDMTGVTGASVWHVPPGNFHYMKVLPLGAGSATAVAHVTDTYI